MPFELYPAIDLKDGQAVRLVQGRMDDATVYSPDPAEVARRWIDQGARCLHVVDLDGAFAGAPQNWSAIDKITDVASAAGVPVQLGGGIRDGDAIERAFDDLGVERVILGTKAMDVDGVANLVSGYSASRIVVGIDAKNGLVATDGWANVTSVRATDLARELAAVGVRTIIYTDIAKDGTMAGPNLTELEIMGRTGLSIIASGGIASLDDLERVRALPGVDGAILGKALYTGAIDLKEALERCR